MLEGLEVLWHLKELCSLQISYEKILFPIFFGINPKPFFLKERIGDGFAQI